MFLKKQPNVNLGSLITYLLQEEIAMKSIASTIDSSITLFVNKKLVQNHMKKTPFFDNTQQDGGDLTKTKKLKHFYCKNLRHVIKVCNNYFYIKAIETTKAKQRNIIIGNNKLYMVVLIIKNGKDSS